MVRISHKFLPEAAQCVVFFFRLRIAKENLSGVPQFLFLSKGVVALGVPPSQWQKENLSGVP